MKIINYLEINLPKETKDLYMVGMQTGTATMENSVEIPLKTGNRTPIQPSNSTAEHLPEETRTERNTCTLMFIAALFTMARTWKQPRCPMAENG